MLMLCCTYPFPYYLLQSSLTSFTHDSQVNMDRMRFDNFKLHIYTTSIQTATVETNPRSKGICYVYPRSTTEVEVRISTSLISEDQARDNLESEMDPSSVTFDEIGARARDVWNRSVCGLCGLCV